MEFHYDIRHVDVAMYYPGVIADIIALPLDEVLQAVPAHARVQYGPYLVFLFAFHEDWWRWGLERRPMIGSGVARVSLTMGKMECSRERLGGSFKRYAPCPTRALIG